jgi:haloacetate dehalogenase
MPDNRMNRLLLDDVEIAFEVRGSERQAIVLLHGWPQTGRCWRKLVGPLANRYTVIVPDLRGYGASGLAETGYDKRATAGDLHALLHHLGHESAIVVGHDRGARVAHRWALDHPSDVSSLALLDVLPTRVVMHSFDKNSASAMWHWFFHAQPDLPEALVGDNVERYLRHFMGSVLESGAVDHQTFAHYVDALRDPAHLHATFEDYRSGFTSDLAADEADHGAGRRLRCPLLLLWGADAGLAGADVLNIWRAHHADPSAVTGQPVPGGHYVPEEAPTEVLDALADFLGEPMLRRAG